MKKNKTPQSEASKYVLLWRSVFGDKLPIDVKLIALEVGKNQKDPVREIRGFSEFGKGDVNCEGALYYSSVKNDWVILYDDKSKRSNNFTIAHELGHYCLHREQYQKFECSTQDINDKNQQDLKKIEKEADTFASYLLMPIDDFRKQVDGQKIDFELFGKCADRYDTSLISVILKWLEFTELHAAFVVSVDGFVLWSSSSKTAKRKRIFFDSGFELPEESFASKGINYKNIQSHSLRTDTWKYPYSVDEMSFYSSAYDSTFTLLIFKDVDAEISYPEEAEEDTVDFFERFDR